MIVTDAKQGWSEKVNFTDKNDVFIGYDMEQSCCEDAGYFFSKEPEDAYSYREEKGLNEEGLDLEGYIFDVNFFADVESSDLDEGEQVCFKLEKEGCEDIFLHLYNSHNGYYSHGFEAKIGGEVWKDGTL